MGHPPFEDVSPVKDGAFPASYVRKTRPGSLLYNQTYAQKGFGVIKNSDSEDFE